MIRFRRKAEEQAQQVEKRDSERALYWKSRLEQAKDGHEVTRIYVEHRHDQMMEWLKDFDRRTTAEMREHTKALRTMIAGLAFVVAALAFWFW